MAQSYYGSIDYNKLIEALKSGKVKTFKTEQGKRYININFWVNDKADQYGNHASVSLPLKDEFKEEKNKVVYIGNLKKSEPKTIEDNGDDFNDDLDNDLPF